MRRGDVFPTASLSKDRRGTCARRFTPYLAGCCMTSFCALQPSASTLTDYGEEHLLTYRGLLDAEGDGAEWDEAALLVLCIDPVREPARAHRAWESHLARAKWLLDH